MEHFLAIREAISSVPPDIFVDYGGFLLEMVMRAARGGAADAIRSFCDTWRIFSFSKRVEGSRVVTTR